MKALLIALFVSTLVTVWVIHSTRRRGKGPLDDDFAKPQKLHVVAVPRLGGLGIIAGLVAATALMWFTSSRYIATSLMVLLGCALPAFVAGFYQDFSDTLTPRGRLLATAVSALLAFWIMDLAITRTAIPGLDWLVSFSLGSLVLTVFTVVGVANAVNLIDGINGLASMCVVLMLAALAYVAFAVDDPLVGQLALAAIGAVLGFFLWNFPAGLIFLGDGGAYFSGFLVAELSILLLNRNLGEVSPLFPLLVCIYPVFETLFSIYRRSVLRAAPSTVPDGIHLHSLIYRRLMRWAVGNRDANTLIRRNSMTSPYLWVLCMASLVPAVLFWDNTLVLALFVLLFGMSYVVLYWRIVRFKSPRWMRPHRRRPAPRPRGDNRRT